MDVELTRISPKGQVVIPRGIRNELGIKSGTRFAVFGQDDTVVFKRLNLPSAEEFRRLTRETSKQAKRRGITRADIGEAILDVRSGK
jgi:AbrB family looped-hinge helix DNA binding protein